jgi:toxin ParE1/3/4
VRPLVKKRPQAREDLLNHFVYIGRRNPEAAERFLHAAEETFALLATAPEIGKPWESRSSRLAGVRSWTMPRYKNYRIFYRPIAGGIEVLYVLYGSRDIQTLLDAEHGEGGEE